MDSKIADDFDYTFKIVLIGLLLLLGDSGVGKSNILSQYIKK